MAKLIIIAAIGKNGELGVDNHLIWHLKGDLKFFKEKTINHKIVMGYNTFKSLPHPLPKREHIVLSHHPLEGIKVFSNFSELLDYLNSLNEEIFIIGGSSVYKLFMPYVQEMYLTEISATAPADAYFPKFEEKDYDKTIIATNVEEEIAYRHVLLRKK